MHTNDLIGTLGVGLILIAYFAATFKMISNSGKLYFGLNVIGAALACYASWLINYYPFIILEAVWTFVSLIAFLRTPKKA